MKYDVFISYRRGSGSYQAQMLRAELAKEHYAVFMDTHEMGGGDFTKKLDNEIRESCNVVFIVSKDCFPHNKEGKDYFLYEIEQAFRQGKNVIPVYYDGMCYEDIKDFLTSVEDFHKHNAITFHTDAPEGSVNQIISFLKTKKEVLNERFRLLSVERAKVRQELMLLEDDKANLKCPVCGASYCAVMTYCHTCGFKFFDKLDESAANNDERIQERERLQKHTELWRSLLGHGQSIPVVNPRIRSTRPEQEGKRPETPNETPCESDNTIEFQLNNELSFKMIHVEGGTFPMGSTKSDRDALTRERPQHWVELNDYYIGETTVTQKLWRAVMKGNPSFPIGDNLPVVNVVWEDKTEKNVSITEFIRKLNNDIVLKKQIPQGLEFRLPSEAEWEYAARGGQKYKGCKYSGSNILDDVAYYWENSGDCILSGEWDWDVIEKNNCMMHPVKGKRPNELGLYDMSGNVREWCWDYYGDKYYAESPSANPLGPLSGTERVIRGGSWYGDARHCRVAYRSGRCPECQEPNIGFRLVLAAPIAESNASVDIPTRQETRQGY